MKKAFTAVVTPRGSMLGRADENIAGYTPLPFLGCFNDHREAQKQADKFNLALGLTPLEAEDIIASTMRAQNMKNRYLKPVAAIKVLLDTFAEAERAGVQGVIYADALHPHDDDKTLVDFLKESIEG